MAHVIEPPIYDVERERLNRRIASIEDKELARALRRYRQSINKRGAIMARGVRARAYSTPKGTRYVAYDEVLLCHRFLDDRFIDEMYA